MTHLGFLTLENWGKIQPLEQSASYYALLRQLDEVCFLIIIFYFVLFLFVLFCLSFSYSFFPCFSFLQ